MNKKDSVPHKENATRMNIQLKKKKIPGMQKTGKYDPQGRKKNIYIYQLKPTQNQHRC